MVGLTQVRGRSVLVFGLGVVGGGESTVRWFARRGARVVVTDRRRRAFFYPAIRRLHGLSVRYVLGTHRSSDVTRAHLILQNPGVPNDHALLRLAKKKQVPIESDISTFFSICQNPIIGVTGTKGKSTTASLTQQFIRSSFGDAVLAGNIGHGVFDAYQKIRPGVPVTIELSSWQLESVIRHRISPHIAVITSITPDHLNRYPSFSAYAKVKKSVVGFQTAGDIAVLNADDPLVRKITVPPGVRRWCFSTRRQDVQAYVRGKNLYVFSQGRAVRFAQRSDIHLFGEHMIRAVLAAALAAVGAGANPSRFATVLKKFSGLPGRLENVRTWQGIHFLNDTTATDPAATMAALSTFPKRAVLIAGGVNKRLPYGSLIRAIRRDAKVLLLLPGTASDSIRRGLRGWSGCIDAPSMETAVARAANLARRGDVVLLSPGAASFNLFLNEFARGDAFTAAVNRLR